MRQTAVHLSSGLHLHSHRSGFAVVGAAWGWCPISRCLSIHLCRAGSIFTTSSLSVGGASPPSICATRARRRAPAGNAQHASLRPPIPDDADAGTLGTNRKRRDLQMRPARRGREWVVVIACPLSGPPITGGALARTGWCWPLRHPSHPRAWGWRAVQSELSDGIS